MACDCLASLRGWTPTASRTSSVASARALDAVGPELGGVVLPPPLVQASRSLGRCSERGVERKLFES